MTLKLNLDTIEGLEPAIASLYEKREDGKYELAAEGLREMQSALKKANSESAQRRKDLEKFKDIDPEKYAELLAKDEERQKTDAEKKGEYEKLIEQIKAKDAEKTAQWAKRESFLLNQLEQRLIDADASLAISEANGVPQLLLPHVRKHAKMHEENGKFAVQILGEDGAPMIVDAAGTLATFKHLVDKMKADPVYGRAFNSSGSSGGGTKADGSKKTGSVDNSSLSPVEKLKAARRTEGQTAN